MKRKKKTHCNTAVARGEIQPEGMLETTAIKLLETAEASTAKLLQILLQNSKKIQPRRSYNIPCEPALVSLTADWKVVKPAKLVAVNFVKLLFK